MSKHERFNLKNLEELKALSEKLGLNVPFQEDITPLLEPIEIAGHKLSNRLVVHPMEGFDSAGDGAPGELSIRRYLRYAKGGSAFIWFEATAVLAEARSNPNQLWIHEGNVDSYARLVEETRKLARESFGHEILIVMQLTHSGRYSKPASGPKPIIAHHSEVLDKQHNLPADYPVITDEELDTLQETFVSAAKLAKKAGFDGVDVKACHRYLVSELLASHTREGRYGGSFENRTRFLREVIEKVQAEIPGFIATTRMNVYDAISYPYGWGVDKDDYRKYDLTEPMQLAKILQDELSVPTLNISIGNPYFNPHYGRPYDKPVLGVNAPEEHPLEGISRFLEIIRTMQHGLTIPVIATGYGWLRQFMPNVAAATVASGDAQLIGQGRNAFAYPDSPKDLIENGKLDPDKCCVACSGCTQIMRDGNRTGCIIRDGEIYRKEYQLGRKKD